MRTRANATNFSNRNLSYYFKRTRIELAMEGFAIRFKKEQKLQLMFLLMEQN
jgi:hypothetical protein